MIDILINYEHKVREIESLCLIKNEMVKRGFTVEFTSTYDEERVRFKYFQKAKIVISSTLYNDACLFEFVYKNAGFCKKVVNLQWEQSLTNYDECDKNFYQNPKGFAKEALHLCWGDASKKRLLNSGVEDDRAIVVGPIHMDLLNKKYKNYYDNKNEIADIFNLDASKDWVLFISSFTYTNMTKETYNEELKCYGERLNDFKEISTKSKDEILKWLEDGLKTYPNKIFIYRPHPSEKEDERLIKLETLYFNFKIISNLSVKQWIKTSDKILTWYSTSAAEVFFSDKNCHILRPVEIPFEWEVTIYNKSIKIDNLKDFLQLLQLKDEKFPLDLEVLNSYYNYKAEVTTTNRICDILEKMISSDIYDMRKYKSNLVIYIFLQRLRHRILFHLKETFVNLKLLYIIFNFKYLRNILNAHISIMNRMNVDRNKNIATKEEVEIIINKINNCYCA
jgi:surface carbohydrate biosynthesis protein